MCKNPRSGIHHAQIVRLLLDYRVTLCWKFWKFYVLTQNLLLNNTFWITPYSNMILPGLGIFIMSLRLAWSSKVRFPLNGPSSHRFRESECCRLESLICPFFRPWYPLFSKQIIKFGSIFTFHLVFKKVENDWKGTEIRLKNIESQPRGRHFVIWINSCEREPISVARPKKTLAMQAGRNLMINGIYK